MAVEKERLVLEVEVGQQVEEERLVLEAEGMRRRERLAWEALSD